MTYLEEGNTMEGTAVDTDVIIVGAGPTGLMLAGELRLGGARVIVTERLTDPTMQSRGLGFTARTMESFDQRGLLPRWGQLETMPMGHFGGVQFDYTALEDAHFGARGVLQWRTEEALETWATELGADIRRGWEFTELAEGFLDGDAVEITVNTPDGEQRLRASYLVACDGSRSTIRRAAGFDFPGIPASRKMYVADVVGCDLRPRYLGEQLPNGMVMVGPLGDGVDRIIACPHGTPASDRDASVPFEEVADAWEHITGEDIHGGGAKWVSSFTDATRQTSEYRRGRVLVAGDAAHIHLPAGGQGLSTGVQDAVNLGWKLASVARGTAPDSLLDTYHSERHPVGKRLLMNTRAQGTVFLGGEQAQPLRELFQELVQYDEVKRHLAGTVSHLDIRYDLGDAPVGDADHALLGRRMPPRLLVGADGETRITELLHPGHGVLLDLADDDGVRRTAAAWQGRVDVATVHAKPTDGPDPLAGTTALLVRPDGYVAWAGSSAEQGLAAALERWFGPAD
ncbi:FAD-dependent monooxygenase [Streptomyces sp. ISL-86]|uniref:FAD-dependent monooxygenase n=1 Tax=Streptomyces sp. ISL-86 TaxID=2819187 RepID=UPI0020365F5F|nr:FAD-dependent monooxygenase [Streptomyces sp. ISL-86]